MSEVIGFRDPQRSAQPSTLSKISKLIMAIIATAPGVEVQVFVNGQACVEYNDDDEVAAARNVTKYIEAESGANFEFRIRIKPEFAYQDHDLKFYVLVDGTVMCRSVVEKRKVRKDHKLKLESTRFCKNNQWFQRKFTFSNLTIGMRMTKKYLRG